MPRIFAQEDRDSMASSPGDLGSGDTGVELQGHAAVPQVVGPGSQRGAGLGRGEGLPPGLLPDASIAALAEHGTTRTAEQAPVRRGAEAVQV